MYNHVRGREIGKRISRSVKRTVPVSLARSINKEIGRKLLLAITRPDLYDQLNREIAILQQRLVRLKDYKSIKN